MTKKVWAGITLMLSEQLEILLELMELHKITEFKKKQIFKSPEMKSVMEFFAENSSPKFFTQQEKLVLKSKFSAE